MSHDPIVVTDPGHVVHVNSDDEWEVLLDQCARQHQLLVVDFTASWCGPCRHIAPFYDELCQRAANDERARDLFVFAKVDVDVCATTAAACRVEAMPTFHVYWQGSCVQQTRGADCERLRAMLEECDKWHSDNVMPTD